MKPFCADCMLRNESLASPDIRPSLRAHLSWLNAECCCRFVPNKIVFLSRKRYAKLGAEPCPPSLLAHMPGLRPVLTH